MTAAEETYAQAVAAYIAAERRKNACPSVANWRAFHAASDRLEAASAVRHG